MAIMKSERFAFFKPSPHFSCISRTIGVGEEVIITSRGRKDVSQNGQNHCRPCEAEPGCDTPQLRHLRLSRQVLRTLGW